MVVNKYLTMDLAEDYDELIQYQNAFMISFGTLGAHDTPLVGMPTLLPNFYS